MKTKNGLVVIKEDGFTILFLPGVYAQGVYRPNGYRYPGKEKHAIRGRRQREKTGK